MSAKSKKRGGPLPREVLVSKKMSKVLRHDAEKEGLTIGQDGYISMAAVLATSTLQSLKVTFAEVQAIVRDNDKQRFDLIPDPAIFRDSDGPTPAETKANDWVIRANQGHSIKLENVAGLLTPITADNLPTMAVHGTTHANWVLITESGGLKPMERNHVHFASGLPAGLKSLTDEPAGPEATAPPVISGMRASSKILMYLDLPKALQAGLQFGLSQNGVILSEGDSTGLIPLTLFERVEDRTGEGVLLQDGQIIKTAPPHWAKKPRATG